VLLGFGNFEYALVQLDTFMFMPFLRSGSFINLLHGRCARQASCPHSTSKLQISVGTLQGELSSLLGFSLTSVFNSCQFRDLGLSYFIVRNRKFEFCSFLPS